MATPRALLFRSSNKKIKLDWVLGFYEPADVNLAG